jgi:PKD domain
MSALRLRALVVIFGALTLAAVWSGPAAAAPPSNDDFSQAISISSLPFSELEDLNDATAEPGEWFPCYWGNQSAWYSYTPATDQVLKFDTAGSVANYSAVHVFRDNGGGMAGLNYLACAGMGQTTTLRVQAGTTYAFQAVAGFGYGGSVRLNVAEIPPPPNDDFANATPTGAAPFSDTQSAVAASKEPGEPDPSCGPFAPATSWWYAFTPVSTQSYRVSLGGGSGSTVAVFTGTSLADLSQLDCRSSYGGAGFAFRGVAGTTYYIQVSDPYSGAYGPITLNLEVAPAPYAGFSVSPSDPSVFDTVGFWGLSSDPAGNPITQELYEFGDGTSAVGCCPDVVGGQFDATHRYAKDGDYNARVTATTSDGRTATSTLTVHVRTHDVAISKLSVPQTAHPGQTRSITVNLSNGRYPENVRVELYKSVSGGDFVLVGALTHDAPVGKSTPFAFNYTFTADDGVLGKVTFKTVATIVGARDAQPADNAVIAISTVIR